MKIKLSSRKIISRLLFAVGFLTVIAVSLMLLTAKTANEKAVDIVVLLIGSIALVMAILTEAELERHSKRFSVIQTEMAEAIKQLKSLTDANNNLNKKIQQEIKSDKEISKKLDEIIK